MTLKQSSLLLGLQLHCSCIEPVAQGISCSGTELVNRSLSPKGSIGPILPEITIARSAAAAAQPHAAKSK